MSDTLPDCPNPHGFVNSRISFSDRDGQRLIFVNSQAYYTYDLDDKITARSIWTQIQIARHASFIEIAAATGIPLRTLQSWKARFCQGGLEALIDQPISGRPRQLTTLVEAQILTLIDQGHSHDEVARKLGISGSSIDRAVAASKSAIAASQALPKQDDFAWEEAPAIDPNEQAEPLPEESQALTPAPQDDSPESGLSEQPTAESALSEQPTAESALSKQPTAAAPQEQPSQRPWCGDPLNRATDRAFARLGMLEDADPQFAEGDNIRYCGWFMIATLLEEDPLLDTFAQVYGRLLGPAFYGLRTLVMTLLMMALLRIKRPEHLRSYHPVSLGRILGLDRIMEVKTLRRKLHTLAAQPHGVELMDKVAEARSRLPLLEPTDNWRTTYLDGHVQAYWGKIRIGQTWSATANRTVKGRTDTWVNLDGQSPLFYITASFNQGMKEAVRKSHGKIVEMLGENVILIFDREVWDTAFLKELDQLGLHFITYRKGAFSPLPEEQFPQQPTKIGKRQYSHAPIDHQQSYNIHEQTYDETTGRTKKRKIGQISFREIRILRDNRKQIAVVTNLTAAEQTNEQVLERIAGRWGNQENVFKYMIQEFSLDALLEYNQSDSPESRAADQQISSEVDHPNPDYNKLSKELKNLGNERKSLLAKYGLVYEELGEKADKEGAERETMLKKLTKLRQGTDGKHLDNINAQIEQCQSKRAETKQRESVVEAGYTKLRSGIKQMADTVKISAYHLESRLYEMLGPHYANTEKEGRKLLAAAMRSSGTIRHEGKKIVVKLEEQASPNRTAAIDALCNELTERQASYPGTDLVIEFDTQR